MPMLGLEDVLMLGCTTGLVGKAALRFHSRVVTRGCYTSRETQKLAPDPIFVTRFRVLIQLLHLCRLPRDH